MFQLLAERIIDDVIEEEERRWGHVDSDVIAVHRRSADVSLLTSQQIQQLVDAHNERRRSVRATNMELMVCARPFRYRNGHYSHCSLSDC